MPVPCRRFVYNRSATTLAGTSDRLFGQCFREVSLDPLSCFRIMGLPRWSNQESMGWTGASVGQTMLNERKFQCADELYKCRWKDYTSLERCASFFRESQKVCVGDGMQTVWESLHTRFKAEVTGSEGRHALANQHRQASHRMSM